MLSLHPIHLLNRIAACCPTYWLLIADQFLNGFESLQSWRAHNPYVDSLLRTELYSERALSWVQGLFLALRFASAVPLECKVSWCNFRSAARSHNQGPRPWLRPTYCHDQLRRAFWILWVQHAGLLEPTAVSYANISRALWWMRSRSFLISACPQRRPLRLVQRSSIKQLPETHLEVTAQTS